jgi:hypothetical protein
MAGKKKRTTPAIDDSSKTESKFAEHAQDDSALAPKSNADIEPGLAGPTLMGRIVIFLLFPTLVGVLGLYMGYLGKRDDPDRDLSFDTDFALPFTLALSMCIVISFQTGGFTSSKPKSLVKWPKVKKRRKVVHKYVVKGQNEGEKTADNDSDKDEGAKKTD